MVNRNNDKKAEGDVIGKLGSVVNMPGEISKSAKYIFLLYFIVTIVFGAFWFLLPAYWNTLTGWPSEIASGRIVGAAIIVMAIGALLAYRATSWQQVEIFVMMGIMFGILGVLGLLWDILAPPPVLPMIAWLLVGLQLLLWLLLLYVYFKGRKS